MSFYTNPGLTKLILNPHFENQESGQYPNEWAMHDLRTCYSDASGHLTGGNESMPWQECGNDIIVVLAYVQCSGDTDYIKQHYMILKQWVDYLIEDSLYPDEQLLTDGFAGHLVDQTNISGLARWVNETPMSKPSTNLYQTSYGSFPPGLEFKARLVVGDCLRCCCLSSPLDTK